MKIERVSVEAKELFEEVEEFERHYGVPTKQLEQAFTRAGRLVETEDYARWSMIRPIFDKVLARRELYA